MLRRMDVVFAVAFLALAGLAGCGNDESSPVAVDTVPPAVVTGLAASVSATDTPSIGLTWDPGTEADLVGYRVYRNVTREVTGSTKRGEARIDLALVYECTEPIYLDTTVLLGESYVYAVTAVDVAGNEGPRSITGSIAVVPPTHLPEERINQ
jgi:fibronectin type 3 domain-containing protein